MTSSAWRDCIVAYVDLVDIAEFAESGAASRMMRQLHDVAADFSRRVPSNIDHLYAWNDSLLAVSFLKDGGDRRIPSILASLKTLKTAVDRVRSSYVIAVKGRAFPRPIANVTNAGARFTVLAASSLAMANCFRIERSLGRRRMAWYLDCRITKHADDLHPSGRSRIRMYPRETRRTIHLFEAELS